MKIQKIYSNGTSWERVKLHLEFWKEISGDNVNVKRIIDISENINSVHSRIKKCWKKNEHNFPKVYLSSLILYGLYFDFIRGMPQESIPIIPLSAKKNS